MPGTVGLQCFPQLVHRDAGSHKIAVQDDTGVGKTRDCYLPSTSLHLNLLKKVPLEAEVKFSVTRDLAYKPWDNFLP